MPAFEETLPPWIDATKAEWERLEQGGKAVTQLTPAIFAPHVLWGRELWLVMFTGGRRDQSSQRQKANFLRLGAELAGNDRVKLGIFVRTAVAAVVVAAVWLV